MKSLVSPDRSAFGTARGEGASGSSSRAARGAQARYGNAFLQERLRAQAGEQEGDSLDAEQEEAPTEAAGLSTPAPGFASGDGDAPATPEHADRDNAGPGAEAGAGPSPSAAGSGATGRAAPAGSAAPVIEFSNVAPDAASQSRFDRSVVGIGERINFSCAESGGTWAATGGAGAETDLLYEWQAPGAPGRYTISYTIGERVGRTVITVLAPASISARKLNDAGFGAGTQGAGMELQLTMNPTTVSFAEAEWLEDAGPGIVSGYFTRFPASAVAHRPNPAWTPMGGDNAAVVDNASFGGWGTPWAEGTWVWSIPNRYRVAGLGAGTVFTTSTQAMAIHGPSGASTVSKLGQSSSRSPG
ncbi:hypothetical protein LBMAG42_56530 [Deltaproteobacteria bacterium]|nr:hypothetical protein LBMAG42_56530 [Deltaproteobacteria bacterium]